MNKSNFIELHLPVGSNSRTTLNTSVVELNA